MKQLYSNFLTLRSKKSLLLSLCFLCTFYASNAQVYTAGLSGLNEAPANNSPGTGTATVTVIGTTIRKNPLAESKCIGDCYTYSRAHNEKSPDFASSKSSGMDIKIRLAGVHSCFQSSKSSKWCPTVCRDKSGVIAGGKCHVKRPVVGAGCYSRWKTWESWCRCSNTCGTRSRSQCSSMDVRCCRAAREATRG